MRVRFRIRVRVSDRVRVRFWVGLCLMFGLGYG